MTTDERRDSLAQAIAAKVIYGAPPHEVASAALVWFDAQPELERLRQIEVALRARSVEDAQRIRRLEEALLDARKRALEGASVEPTEVTAAVSLPEGKEQ